jgi:predicted aspartyl protease
VYAITFYDVKGNYKHVVFHVHVRVKYSENISESWKVLALLDTGATRSGITHKLANRMKLISKDTKDVGTANGKLNAPLHTIDVILPKEKIIEDLEVVEIADDDSGYEFIIGMDIIKMGDLAITYASGKLMFSFRMPPAEKHIDFEYELMKEIDPDVEMLYP